MSDNIINFPRRPVRLTGRRKLAEEVRRLSSGLPSGPLVEAEFSGDGRVSVCVPFASAHVTPDEARELAYKLLRLAHALDGRN